MSQESGSLPAKLSHGPSRQIRVPGTTEETQWNTRSLGLRLGADAASAAVAGGLISPIITVLDRYDTPSEHESRSKAQANKTRAIIEKAAKGINISHTVRTCLRSMVTQPMGFFLSTPFLLIYTLYTGTYLTANTIDTVSSTLRNRPFATVSPGPEKFVATSTYNMAMCVYKDSRFVRIFGPSSDPSPASTSVSGTSRAATTISTAATTAFQKAPKVPKASYALFCLRDSATIFASFNVPALIAPSIPDALAATTAGKAALAQMASPALMQFVSTPIHLLGLDLYNRYSPQRGLGWKERLARVRRDYVASSFARIGRIVPAFGVGGVVNMRLRAKLMEGLEVMDEGRSISREVSSTY